MHFVSFQFPKACTAQRHALGTQPVGPIFPAHYRLYRESYIWLCTQTTSNLNISGTFERSDINSFSAHTDNSTYHFFRMLSTEVQYLGIPACVWVRERTETGLRECWKTILDWNKYRLLSLPLFGHCTKISYHLSVWKLNYLEWNYYVVGSRVWFGTGFEFGWKFLLRT